MRTLIFISMGLVALAAFALSFQSLMALAALTGYARLSFLYPLVIDLGTVASCAAWMTTKSRQAFHLTWCLLTASILLNGVEHWLVAASQRPAWWLITVIAMAPPAILGVVTHLAVGLGNTSSAICPDEKYPQVSEGVPDMHRPGQPESGGAELAGSIAPQVGASQELTDVSQVTDVANGANGGHEVAQLLAQGAGRRKIAKELDISEYEARKLISASRNGDGR